MSVEGKAEESVKMTSARQSNEGLLHDDALDFTSQIIMGQHSQRYRKKNTPQVIKPLTADQSSPLF